MFCFFFSHFVMKQKFMFLELNSFGIGVEMTSSGEVGLHPLLGLGYCQVGSDRAHRHLSCLFQVWLAAS